MNTPIVIGCSRNPRSTWEKTIRKYAIFFSIYLPTRATAEHTEAKARNVDRKAPKISCPTPMHSWHAAAAYPVASRNIPMYLLGASRSQQSYQTRLFSTSRRMSSDKTEDNSAVGHSPRLTHVSASGSAHMVSISSKQPTSRTAKAVCSVRFSSPIATTLIRENALKKGDVLGVARIAGIMAAKRTPDLIPLCHPIAISKVAVELVVVDPPDDGVQMEDKEKVPGGGRVDIEAVVSCEGKTGVEMEALTAASTAALTVYDMCKAVDKGMVVEGLRVVLKEGGKSGRWVEGMQED